jgi:hypothetical protein
MPDDPGVAIIGGEHCGVAAVGYPRILDIFVSS